jgi:Ca2+-binding RTX toxin-like protein
VRSVITCSAAACLGIIALAPTSAQASTVAIDGGAAEPVAQARGGPGEANDMTVRSGGDGVIFTDTVGITPENTDNGCRPITETEVTCAADGGALLGGEGDDILRDAGVNGGFEARGGPGSDQIFGGAGVAIIYGDDREVLSTDGDDTIVGGTAAGGQPFDDLLAGGGGNDVIDGREGNDDLAGNAGSDTLRGGAGDDNLEGIHLLTADGEDAPGHAGDDTLLGEAGNDVIRAIDGRDKADGGDGDDWLIAVNVDVATDDNSSDTLTCGAGTDRVSAGSGDKVAVGCETLYVRLYCSGVKTCKASGSLTGKAKGAKKTTTVAKIKKTVATGDYASFSLGKKATKLFGSSKKVTLTLDVTTRSGTKVVGGQFFRFQLVR